MYILGRVYCCLNNLDDRGSAFIIHLLNQSNKSQVIISTKLTGNSQELDQIENISRALYVHKLQKLHPLKLDASGNSFTFF